MKINRKVIPGLSIILESNDENACTSFTSTG